MAAGTKQSVSMTTHSLPVNPQKTQTKMPDFNNNPFKSVKLGQERTKAIDEALLRLIVGKCLPPSLVDNIHFKNFVAALEPRYQCKENLQILWCTAVRCTVMSFTSAFISIII